MLVYNTFVRLYGTAIRIASWFRPKPRLWITGRAGWRQHLAQRVNTIPEGKRLWVHCASYGEFEQGRPLLEELRKRSPQVRLIVTFFSPSGYEPFKNWKGADLIYYLPLDTGANARDFLDLIRPDLSVFVKYEFWLNYLNELRKRKVPTYLVSAVFKPHHPFFKWYGGVYRRSLTTYERIFVQDGISAERLKEIGISNYEIAGDTRFDRVISVLRNGREVPEILSFKADNSLVIGGSTWPQDEALLAETILRSGNNVRFLIVPHNLDPAHKKATAALLDSKKISYSMYSQGVKDTKVLVLDTMGLLSTVYRYADCAYVGGGFGRGIHNLLEPAVYGIPVAFFGHNFHKFNEAVALVELSAARSVNSAEDLHSTLDQFLNDQIFRNNVRLKLQSYFNENSGGTEKVLATIIKRLSS